MVITLDESEVRAALRWPELIDAMEAALAAFSTGRVLQPVRNMIAIEEDRRYLGVMPAVGLDVTGLNAMGLKLVSFYPCNAGSGIPTHMGMVLLFRPETGEPLAVLDGRVITEMRTAAVSAAVTRALAAPQSGVLAVLGSGVQARAHLEALVNVCRFDRVKVWSRTPAHARRLAAEYGGVATDAESAVRDADVVVTATSSRQPVLKGAWLKPGALVNAVGAPRPHWRELDDEAMSNLLVVDSREGVLKESGDVILSGARIYAEAGEIFAGRVEAPRDRTTIFKSVGMAVEDIAAAKLALDRHCRLDRSG